MPTSGSPYVDAAEEYSRGVLAGEIPACHWVKKACERQVRDLARQDTPDFPYVFDISKAHRICSWMEQMPHVKGPKANKEELLVLEPWQTWFWTTAFGWINKKTTFRRFHRVYKCVPRGNGKSFELAAIGNYMAFAEGEQGAEVYSTATTREQSKIVWTTAKRMMQRRSDLADHLGVTVSAHAMYQENSGSNFIALSAEDNTLDGLNVYLGIIDELHAHKTRGIYDVLETAISKRSEALILIITTAGNDRTGICYEVQGDLQRILEGTASDEHFFGAIWTIDPEDSWQDEATWKKANPNWEVSVNPEYVRTLAAKAERIPAAQSAFLTKHLNVWVGANEALFDSYKWVALGDEKISRERFKGEPCISSVDLATKDDLATRCDLFWEFDELGRVHFYPFWRHYLPEERVFGGSNDRYPGWTGSGWITATPGNTTDMATIEADILTDGASYDIDPLAFDPWQATYLAQRLADAGVTTLEVRPTVANFSEATKTLGALISEGRVHHNGDPVASWSIGNVMGHFDAKDNVFPRKEKPENKIDPTVALISALSVFIRRQDPWAYSKQTGTGEITFI